MLPSPDTTFLFFSVKQKPARRHWEQPTFLGEEQGVRFARLREERGGWQSQAPIRSTHLPRPQRSATGCRWVQGASSWWTTACSHGASVSGSCDADLVLCPEMQGPQGHVDAGKKWHQWHGVCQNCGGRGEQRQREPCTSDLVILAFYSVV